MAPPEGHAFFLISENSHGPEKTIAFIRKFEENIAL